ncbi:TetR/AcrR family transcriptional regulator [Paenibacillus taichungensis]|uniref:TetR/AcrR family transcriptional regulator n=1 Tax=Paenibacillus taichungensis TaxID=484184 RepID=UPI003D9A292B
MTLERIKQASVMLFSIHGFDGTSLQTIAQQVGIQKPSIYTYFTSKDALYLELLHDSLTQELDFARQLTKIRSDGAFKEVLFQFLSSFIDRYESEPSVSYMLKTFLYPPQHLQAPIQDLRNHYIDELERILFTVFSKEPADQEFYISLANSGQYQVVVPLQRTKPYPPAESSFAFFMVHLQGLWVELLRSGAKRAYVRLQRTWPLVSASV